MAYAIPPPPSSFALFPSSVPKISIPNPHQRRGTSLSKITSPADTATPTKSPHGESVIIHISHDPSEQSQLQSRQDSAYSSNGPRSQTPSPEYDHDRAAMAVSPLDGGRTPSPAAPPIPPIPASFATANPNTTKKPTTLPPPPPPLAQPARTRSTTSPALSPTSPIVPIRSMFPTYNPTMPLSRQPYYPTRTISLPRTLRSHPDYDPSIISPSSPFDDPRASGGSGGSIVNFPLTVREPEQQFSSQRDLEKLWEACNGMDVESESGNRIGAFDLEMSRMDESTFRFGSSPLSPFYSLQTYSNSEISVSRSPPWKRNTAIDILLLTLTPSAQGGLLSFVFPKLAAMMAIEQSNELAARHQLAPTHRDEMQSDAVKRAAAQEACRLFARGDRYEIEHPAIGRRPRSETDFAISPTSPQGTSDVKPVLHVTVAGEPPVISVTNPNAPLSPESRETSPHAGIRLSTLPQSDSAPPALASLDLGTKTLHVDAAGILALMPSLYAIDCITSAIFAVAIADGLTNPILANMPVWTPRPSHRAPVSVYGGSIKSYAGSTFYATLAEREEAESEAKLMSQIHKEDIKKSRSDGSETQKGWFGREKKAKKVREKKQIVIGEFDLEKLGHYQAGDRKGEELPAATRGVLAALVWGLRMVVWLLTVIVQGVMWVLVGGTRCVTSEKF